ncbi:MAG: MurR/RpiR family transcriptional regulator [Candidatus Limnocylindrales bacterium]
MDKADPGVDQDSDVIQAVRRAYDELTRSQKRIAEAIVDDPEFVAFATVDKMASRLNVSPSTVVRFTYRLGLTGYQDLQERVRILVRSQMRSATAEVDEQQVLAHLGDTAYARSFRQDLDHLRRTIVGLEPAVLEEAIALISAARRVLVAGDGTAYGVAHFMSLALDRTRGQALLVRADGESVGRLVDIGAEDVMIAFTFPPYASTVLRAVRWANSRGVRVVGVTDSPISPVGQLVDVVLPTLVSGIGPQNTLVAAMAVANALLNGVVLRIQDRALERYGTVSRLMDEWDNYVLKSGDD